MTGFPNRIKATHSRGDNVASILCGRAQFYACGVAVVFLIDCEWAGFEPRADMPAILVLLAQLFSGTRRIHTNSLMHLVILSDPITEAAAADDLLFRRRKFLEFEARLAAQLSHRSLYHNAEMLAYHRRARVGQLQCGFNTHNVELFRYPASDTPDLIDRHEAHQFALARRIG